MSDIGKPERATQNRIIAAVPGSSCTTATSATGPIASNRHIEEGLLADWLKRRGHTPEQIGRALDLLGREANNPTRSLYDNNKAVYSLLRYGVPVKTEAGENTETVMADRLGEAGGQRFRAWPRR